MDEIQNMALRLVSPAELREMVQTLTRERDEARAKVEELRAALRLAEDPIAIAASYADQPCETIGMRVHAKDCARVLPEIHAALAGEGEAKECWCQWEAGDSPCPTHGMDE